jgi:superfamily II DNA or RNA helicase
LRLATSRKNDALILATGKYVGEGFDDPRLDTLFLTLPVSWRGTVAQYAGRPHRLYDGKREVRIHDYADLNVPMLAGMFDRRWRQPIAAGDARWGAEIRERHRKCRFGQTVDGEHGTPRASMRLAFKKF